MGPPGETVKRRGAAGPGGGLAVRRLRDMMSEKHPRGGNRAAGEQGTR